MDILVYPAGTGESAEYAAAFLKKHKIPLVDHPTPEVTHLLLDVPSRNVPKGLLEQLPESITVTGGNLDRPDLTGYRKLDLLKLEKYLAENASITADCALRIAAARLKTTFSESPTLIIGWGRIGKCLASLLRSIGCPVTVAARKAADLAMLDALGYDSTDLSTIRHPERFAVIYNTAPAPVLDRKTLTKYPGTLKIDLASLQGLDGPDVIWARGLPGLYAPESSGRLIAETFLKEVTV